MKVKRTVVYGYHGMLNFGDDLFVDAVSNTRSILASGRSPIFVTVPYRRGKLARLFRSPTPAGTMLRISLMLLGLMRSRRVAFVGGSTVSRFSGIQRVLVSLARLRVIQLELIGVSIGPFGTDRQRDYGLEVVKLSKRVVVRDHASEKFVRSAGEDCNLSGDLAALSTLRNRVEKARKGSVLSYVDLALFPCATAGLSVEQLDERMRALIAGLGLGSDHRVAIVALNSNEVYGDASFCDELASSLGSVSPRVDILHYSELGLEGLAEFFATLKVAVSMRLHGSIAAYLSEVPFANVSYHRKGIDFSADVGLIGQRQLDTNCSCADWHRAGLSLRSSDRGVERSASDYVSRARLAFSG